ncbi:MAG TPA: regulatory protein RecX [Candidatus Nitrosotalea sp.]|nr:regulatory protein RecX [Candidatus Nitrosotalea sp.]
MTSPKSKRPPASALEVATRLLARRDHAVSELRWKLRRRGYEDSEVELAIERLLGAGHLSDARFASGLVRRHAATRSRAAVAAELAGRGIGRELSNESLSSISPETELDAARRCLARWPGLDPDLASRRLMRRGFGFDVLRRLRRA